MPRLDASLIEETAAADPDRVLATSFAPPPVRTRLIALIAFNHELARAREAVREPALTAIRLEWWREMLAEARAQRPVRRHPVALALAGTLGEVDLPASLLDTMIDAREALMETSPFADMPALEAHLDATAGHLIRASLLASGLTALSGPLDDLARHAGLAWGLAGLSRSLGWWHARQTCLVPESVLVPAGVGAEALGDPAARARVARALLPLCADHMRRARRLARRLDPDCLAAVVYAGLAPAYLRRAVAGRDDPPPLLLRQLGLLRRVAFRTL